ncbi:MAG: neutral/alkaline non-lysosomal ceramidase N-terminal domain-containing protein, partial [Bryobacteraceae bacterium]
MLAFVLALLAPLAADVPPSGLRAGVARANINPPAGIPHMNWGAQTHIEAAGLDPVGMKATALVVSDGKQKFAMVDVDALFVDYLRDVPRRAAARTGIPEAHIRLAATHTHAGPMLTSVKGPVGVNLDVYKRPFESYWEVVAGKVVDAIAEANSRLVPVHVYGGRGTGTININRRRPAAGDMPPSVGLNPEGFVDRELVVIRIDDSAGKPLAVLANFQCHGTVLAWDNKLISPDWVGRTRQAVEQAMPGTFCLFFQGAAGNQGPIEGFTGDLSVAHRLGATLGHQVVALALAVETTRRQPRFEGFAESTAFIAKQPWRATAPRDGTLKFASRTLDLPPRRYTPADIDRMASALAAAGKQDNPARTRRFRDLLEQWKKPHDPTPRKVQVQILRIGEVALVAMPGEPFAEI